MNLWRIALEARGGFAVYVVVESLASRPVPSFKK
jgi:hypothetical protein